MAIVEILMPQMSMGDTEGVVLDWLKGVGDTIDEDEPVVNVETAKAEVEILSPASGVLDSINVQAGSNAEAGDVLGTIATAD